MMAEKNNFQVMRDLQGFFKDGERKAIYNSAENLRDKVLIRLLWVTGRRLSEILHIKINEINAKEKSVVIHVEKKTKKIKEGNIEKRVRLDYVALSYLDDFTIKLIIYFVNINKLQANDYLFKSDFKDNQPISRQRAFQVVRNACSKVGIERVGKDKPHPHHFRHSYAIDQAKSMKHPADVRKLQMALNHSSLAVTEQYLKFSDKEIKSLVNNVKD